MTDDNPCCSFCGNSKIVLDTQGTTLIQGMPGKFICSTCVARAWDALANSSPLVPRGTLIDINTGRVTIPKVD